MVLVELQAVRVRSAVAAASIAFVLGVTFNLSWKLLCPAGGMHSPMHRLRFSYKFRTDFCAMRAVLATARNSPES
jgi:hypothetical protein